MSPSASGLVALGWIDAKRVINQPPGCVHKARVHYAALGWKTVEFSDPPDLQNRGQQGYDVSAFSEFDGEGKVNLRHW